MFPELTYSGLRILLIPPIAVRGVFRFAQLGGTPAKHGRGTALWIPAPIAKLECQKKGRRVSPDSDRKSIHSESTAG